jgi:hypothetical protein
VLASRDRTQGAPTFDAAGLYLERVDYDAEWRLPAPSRAPIAAVVDAAAP